MNGHFDIQMYENDIHYLIFRVCDLKRKLSCIKRDAENIMLLIKEFKSYV
jgi:hypothetical protein